MRDREPRSGTVRRYGIVWCGTVRCGAARCGEHQVQKASKKPVWRQPMSYEAFSLSCCFSRHTRTLMHSYVRTNSSFRILTARLFSVRVYPFLPFPFLSPFFFLLFFRSSFYVRNGMRNSSVKYETAHDFFFSFFLFCPFFYFVRWKLQSWITLIPIL